MSQVVYNHSEKEVLTTVNSFMSNYKDEIRYSSLAKIMSDIDYVIIDTCSLMEDSFPEWLDILVETKEEYLDSTLPIYVLESSVKELERLSKDRRSVDRKIAAKRALRILKKSKRHKVVDFVNIGTTLEENSPESEDGEYAFADPRIVSLINLDRIRKNIVAITQDKKLASDILRLKNQQSVHGKIVKVYKIDENAALQPNLGEEPAPAKKATKSSSKEKKKETKNAPIKSAAKTKKPKDESAELLEKILNADQRLHSILSNPTYPSEKKVQDLKTQLADLEKLGEAKLGNSKLKHDIPSIKEDIKRLEAPIALPLKEEKPKALPMQEAKPVQTDKKAAKKDLWYEYGQTVEEAFRNVGNHYGVVFRDPNVAYVPNVHGPVNFTQEDLTKIAAAFGNTLKEGQKIVKQYKTVNLMAERTQKGIKAWLDVERKLITIPSPKPSVEPLKEVAPVKENAKETPKQKPAKKTKKPAKAASNEANKVEEPVQKEDKDAVPTKKATNVSPTKEEKPKKLTKLDEATLADKRLKANIHNSNYPKPQKLKDVEEQIARIKKIPLKDRGGLYFSLDSLKALLEFLR